MQNDDLPVVTQKMIQVRNTDSKLKQELKFLFLTSSSRQCQVETPT
jgi:hypothetical protein